MERNLGHKLRDEDGYDLWLRYVPVADTGTLAAYRTSFMQVIFDAPSPTLQAAREELQLALRGLLGSDIPLVEQLEETGTLIIGTPTSSPLISPLNSQEL